MRVLVVSHYYSEHSSGVEILAGRITELLAQRGWKVTWIASDVECASSALQKAAAVIRKPMRTWNYTEDYLGVPYPIWGPISVFKLCLEVRSSDLVYLHDCLYFGSIIAYICARLNNKPVIITQHIGHIPYKNSLLRIVNYLANRIVGRLLLSGCAGGFLQYKGARLFFQVYYLSLSALVNPQRRKDRHLFACESSR